MTSIRPSGLPVVQAVGVTRRYGHRSALFGGVMDVSLSVSRGEIVGIRGPSGAGKSTLLRLLAGTERPDGGELTYDGHPAWPTVRLFRHPRSARYPRPGFVMPVDQDPFASLDPRWPIWRIITEPAAVSRSITSIEARDEARRLLERSGMENVDLEARPGELSGGQCQRIAILRAIVADPALMVADEPTARQDVITAAAMTEQLRQAAGAGSALIVVSHNVVWLETFVDRILEMADGRLTTAEIRALS